MVTVKIKNNYLLHDILQCKYPFTYMNVGHAMNKKMNMLKNVSWTHLSTALYNIKWSSELSVRWFIHVFIARYMSKYEIKRNTWLFARFLTSVGANYKTCYTKQFLTLLEHIHDTHVSHPWLTNLFLCFTKKREIIMKNLVVLHEKNFHYLTQTFCMPLAFYGFFSFSFFFPVYLYFFVCWMPVFG